MKTTKLASLATAVVALSLALGSPATAKEATAPAHIAAAPLVTTITGNPLQIHVGDDHSFQVFNSLVPGSGQIYPTGATDTADMGWFVRTTDTLYAPNFAEHPSGTATGSIGSYIAFTPVSLSPVSGSGTSADPFRVTVSGTLGASGLSANQQVLYVNGNNYFTEIFTLSNNGGASQAVKIFVGADIYLASSDAGVPFLEPTSSSPGGQDCATPPTYTILLIPQTTANAYSGRGYNTIWSEIGAAQLDGLIDTGCEDNGAALQWNRTLAGGASTVVQSATSFGDIPAITQFNVSAVNPPSGNPGSNVNVTITGLGFLAGTTFTFGAGITVTNLVIVDVNTATATLVISPSAVPGPRDVTGTQSIDGLTATLVNGFTVLGGTPPPPPTAVAAPTLGIVGMIALLLAMLLAGAYAWRRN